MSQNLLLEDLIQKALSKVNGKKERDLCRFLPCSRGYMHHFTFRKMMQERPQQLFDLIQEYIIEPEKPQEIHLKPTVEVHETKPEMFNPQAEVAACYLECDGKLLLLLNAPGDSEAGSWGVPAGKLESNEPPLYGAIRELFEETSISEYLKSLSELIKAYDIPGLSLALISDKKIVTFECGVKNSIYENPVTSSTVFEAASLSKPLIAYAALELCEKGLLEMDQPLSTYLTSPESEDPFLPAVTLRHVLSHTGGFPTANLKPGESLKLEFYPGSQFAYSGESFCYLGRVIEQITGDSLASYMQEHVLTKLKMNNSSFIWKKSYTTQAASPHDQKGLPTEKWKPVKAIASFSLHTTASDYAKFMIIARRFSVMSEIQIQNNKEIGWGLGWGIEITPEGSSSWHSGDNGTFQCLAFQNEQTGFVIMTNSANGMKIYRHIFDLLIGGEHPLFDWEQFDSRAEEKLDEEYLANWWKIYE